MSSITATRELTVHRHGRKEVLTVDDLVTLIRSEFPNGKGLVKYANVEVSLTMTGRLETASTSLPKETKKP